jgi:restriction system protein
MALPDYQTLMLPCLKSVSKRDLSTVYDILADIQKEFALTEEQMAELLPSGLEPVIKNRVGWAVFYLMKAELLRRPSRGRYQITDTGKKAKISGDTINNAYLMQFDNFKKFVESSRKPKEKSKDVQEVVIENEDPRELFESSYEQFKSSICAELLSTVRTIDPRAFELLVIELLRRMGYGTQNIAESIRHTGKSGDGGIDGEIYQDVLGLDKIFIQAKRYKEGSSVGREDLQKFVGSLNERKSKKGIFITSSHFNENAREYTQRVDVSIALVDGKMLAELMYKHDLGVSPKKSLEIKEIDHDFFEE